ncbi:SymE family type I addiction module toxin [Dyadobacter sp. 32]|uniref:SymE family type I addiction module toxin n=1 Tax=Dyadobacter sp. 32 TaxID=538966 RepID=UPI0011EFADD4
MERKIQHKAERRSRGYRWVPSLLLSGVWFQEAGFQAGEKVTISVVAGQVIISK